MEERTLGDVVDVRRAIAVLIHDAWVGYNHHSPIARAYDLRRGPRGGFSGDGRLSTAVAGERVVPVAIGAAATAALLDRLAAASIVEGAYVPFQDHTDDYPHLEVAMHVPATDDLRRQHGIALLFSESQGEFHAPWGACIDGKMWTLPGDEVGRALDALRGPLKEATLRRMIREADRAVADPPGDAGIALKELSTP